MSTVRRWFRVDPWGVRQVFTGLMLLVGSTFVTLVLVLGGTELVAEPSVRSTLGVAGPLAFLAVWLTFAARLHLAGVYVGRHGVRLRHVLRTRTIPWSQVTGFAARPALLAGEPTIRDACWVLTADGAFETPVQRRSRGAGWRKDVGPVLSEAAFDRLLAYLAAALADARRSGAVQAGGGAAPR